MRGRMIHGKKGSGELFEESQDYDIHGRVSNRSSFYITSFNMFRLILLSTVVD